MPSAATQLGLQLTAAGTGAAAEGTEALQLALDRHGWGRNRGRRGTALLRAGPDRRRTWLRVRSPPPAQAHMEAPVHGKDCRSSRDCAGAVPQSCRGSLAHLQMLAMLLVLCKLEG